VGLISAPRFTGQSSSTIIPQPSTRVASVTDTLHGIAIEDPYRWLERQEDPETRAWIEAQNAYTEAIVGESALRTAVHDRLTELMDIGDIGTPQTGGAFEYFTMRRRGQDLPVLYRRPNSKKSEGAEGERARRLEPITLSKSYEVVIDPHPLSEGHTTRVELLSVSDDGRHLLYAIRDGGQDEVEVRVRDLKTGQDMPDRLPPALYDGFSLDADGKGFFYTRRSRQTGPRVYYHEWGTPVDRDRVVFGEGYGPECFVRLSQADKGRYQVITVQHGWARTDVFVSDREKNNRHYAIIEGADARFYPRMVDSKLWMRTDLDASHNRLVAIDLENPAPDRWKTVLPESDDVLEDFTIIGDSVYATYLSNVSNRVLVFAKDGRPRGEMEVPPFQTASLRGIGGKEALFTLESFTTPRKTWRINAETEERQMEDAPDVPFDGSNILVEQIWYTSKDGTSVPMFLVRRRDVPRDSERPTLLYGYGGFYAATKPAFSPTAAIWVESGGIYAVANIRGGSEFGERWHRAGMLTNKQRVFDDFIAAAEWLIDNKVTRRDRLAISGVSNGGLLVGAALTQRPDLFRAVLCRFPDVDILRFFQFTDNNNMPALLEYGNASIREHFEAIRRYSPYQNVRPNTPYPAVMITSGDLDTRVPPLSARKFAARLQASTTSALPVILHYDPKAGHASGYGQPFSRRVADTAMEVTFLMSQVGLTVSARGQRKGTPWH
jgi:prolyl oligopeptidase